MRMQTGMITLALLAAHHAYPAKDSCFDCHSVMEGTSIVFQEDIHRGNRISCADCHGGDPNEDDQNVSMSSERGFKVRVTRDGTPEYCGRCHSDAALIHKRNPKQRVDQLALYRASVHGRPPAGGTGVAATCVDCHGIHDIRAVNDAQSSVSPARMVATCGKCHVDAATPFRISQHGALFVSPQDAACATCHASHATESATREMLAGGRAVCARCHEPDSAGGKTAAELERFFERLTMAARLGTAGPAARAANDSLRKARAAVHALDIAVVKAAAEAAQTRGQE